MHTYTYREREKQYKIPMEIKYYTADVWHWAAITWPARVCSGSLELIYICEATECPAVYRRLHSGRPGCGQCNHVNLPLVAPLDTIGAAMCLHHHTQRFSPRCAALLSYTSACGALIKCTYVTYGRTSPTHFVDPWSSMNLTLPTLFRAKLAKLIVAKFS